MLKKIDNNIVQYFWCILLYSYRIHWYYYIYAFQLSSDIAWFINTQQCDIIVKLPCRGSIFSLLHCWTFIYPD